MLYFYHLLTLFRSYAETYCFPDFKSALLRTFPCALIPLTIQETKSLSPYDFTHKKMILEISAHVKTSVFKLHFLEKDVCEKWMPTNQIIKFLFCSQHHYNNLFLSIEGTPRTELTILFNVLY